MAGAHRDALGIGARRDGRRCQALDAEANDGAALNAAAP